MFGSASFEFKYSGCALREKPDYEIFFSPYFSVFGLNTGKYGPEKNLFLDTFCHIGDCDYFIGGIHTNKTQKFKKH